MAIKKLKTKNKKGRELELKVARLIREVLNIKAYRSPRSGAIKDFEGDILCNELPFYFECKNREKLNIWEHWQEIRDKKNPVLFISGENRPILAVMDILTFLALIKYFKKV